MGPRAGLDKGGVGNLAPTRIRSPDRPARSQSWIPKSTDICSEYVIFICIATAKPRA